MCGIVGIVGREAVAQRLFDGLKRLEYRGYDSAGICTVQNGEFERRRAEGKLDNLARELSAAELHGDTGIAHTRWATHGAPTVGNAHPHIAGPVALVHNGIIENFKPLRDELIADGRKFLSETDSEVVAHLVAREVERGSSPTEAVATVLPRLHGAFAIAFLFKDYPDQIIGARMGAPLTVGYGEGENYLGSDALALAPLTQKIAYLEEGDWAVVERDQIQIYDRANQPVEREIVESGASAARIEKGNYRHYMQKEIFEQPIVVAQTLQSYVRPFEGKVALPDFDFDLSTVNRVTIVACGTSFYAGMVAKYWFEQFARVPVDIDVASEFRYRQPVLEPGGLALFISQIGRDRRHARRAAPCARRGPDHRGGGQCPDQLDGARGGPAAADPCRAGDRRRLDQGVHLPAGGARRARRQPRLRQGPLHRGRRSRSSSTISSARPRRSTRRSAMTRISRRWRTSSRRRATCSTSAAGPTIRWRWKAR